MKKRAKQDQELLKILKDMNSAQAEYPEELYSSRRASFMDQVARSTLAQTGEQPALDDRKVTDPLRKLGSMPVKYPPLLLAAPRAAFIRQILWINFVSLCAALWLAVKRHIPLPLLNTRKIINRINDATLKRRTIDMIYRTMSRGGEETRRRVDPYRISSSTAPSTSSAGATSARR